MRIFYNRNPNEAIKFPYTNTRCSILRCKMKSNVTDVTHNGRFWLYLNKLLLTHKINITKRAIKSKNNDPFYMVEDESENFAWNFQAHRDTHTCENLPN